MYSNFDYIKIDVQYYLFSFRSVLLLLFFARLLEKKYIEGLKCRF